MIYFFAILDLNTIIIKLKVLRYLLAILCFCRGLVNFNNFCKLS